MKIKNKIARTKAIKSLLEKYKYEIEIEKVMEEWITKRILEGQKGRREELTKKRSRVKELELFINFLSKLK